MKVKKLTRHIGYCATLVAANIMLMSAVHAQTLGSNLALTGSGAGADGSGFSNTKLVRDGDTSTVTYGSGTSNQRVSVKWDTEIAFNTVILREEGSKVTTWQLVDNDSGAVLASGTGIGAQKQVNLGATTSKKINLIVNATSAPGIAEIEVYNANGAVVASSTPASVAASSAPASVAASSTPVTGAQQCNWWGTLYPACVVTLDGWGWENSKSCISVKTCKTQPAPYGIVGTTTPVSSTPASVAASSKPASVAASSTPASVAPSSTPASVAASSKPASAAASSTPPNVSIRAPKLEGFGAYAGVTGGQGGSVVTVSTGTQLNAALCNRGSMTDPITIKVNGTINHGNTRSQGCNTQDDVIEIKKMSNVSIIGVGTNALFDEIGIHVRDASNVIIQNVHIRNVKKSGSPTSNGGDAIGMETSVDRVWIDHNWLEASGGEKDGYDSLLDMKAGVTNVTVSYNMYNDSSRAGLIGSSDSDDANNNITFHHNWYKNIEQRTPLIRHALVHMYNNYWSNPKIDYMFHAINSRMGAKVLVEGNYFDNVNNPLIASDDSSQPGCWQTGENTIVPQIYYSRTVGNGALVIPQIVNGQLQSTCSVNVPYSVVMDHSSNVPAIVMANAGIGKLDGTYVPTSSVAASSTPASSTPASVAPSSTPKSSTPASVAASSAATQTVTYEAESGSLYQSSIDTDHTGFSGSGFVNFDNVATSYGEWTLSQAVAGTATLSIRYANGSAASRPMSVSVNGAVVNSSLAFNATSNWDTWAVQTISLNVKAGSNVIRLASASSTGGPNVDYLQVTASATTPVSSVAASSTPASVAASSKPASVAASSSPAVGGISAACNSLVSNPMVNWRESSLQTDQEIVACLSKTLGTAVGFGEKARGGFNANGGSKLVVITKNSSVLPEQQVLNAISSPDYNWIVFDKKDYANGGDLAMYRLSCNDSAVLADLNNATTAECLDHNLWCKNHGVSTASCAETFFNDRLNDKNLAIRNQMIDSNTTIDGRGTKTRFLFNGFKIGADDSGNSTHVSENVILTHLQFEGAGHVEDHYLDPDMIRSTGESHDIWIHQNTFKNTGDSAFDVKVGAYGITISYNRLEDVLRASLHGSSDSRTINSQIRTTLHNNFFITSDAFFSGPHSGDNTARRVPLLRRGSAHMFNNVFYNYRKNFASVRVGGTLLMEDNVFLGGTVMQTVKSSTAASFDEWLTYLTKDDFDGGYFSSVNGLVTFANSTCRIDSSYQGQLPSVIANSARDLKTEYSQTSRTTISSNRFTAGQDLVDYTNATAGKYGAEPYNSPLAASRSATINLGKASCL